MARWLVRLLSLWLVFTVEIQIHATTSFWLSEPVRCVPGNRGCVYLSRQSKSTLTWDGTEISAASGTVLTWHDSSTLELVRGSALLRIDEGVTAKLASAQFSGHGEVLVQRANGLSEIVCLRGELRIRLLGVKEEIILPAGFRVQVGPVTRDGVAEMEIPLTAPMTPTIRRWWDHYAGTKQAFLPLAKEFMGSVTANVEKASAWHYQLVQRQVASQREADRLERERRLRLEAENKKLRALFRKLNYLGEELPD
jgi:hypothetical protein